MAWGTFNVSSATYDSKTKSFGSTVASLMLSDDGTKAYTLEYNTRKVVQWTLSTAWDISTATLASKELDTTAQLGAINAFNLFIGSSGTKVYVNGANNYIYQYTLSTAWDISTASYDSKNYTPSYSIKSFFINPTGGILYIGDNTNGVVKQYTLSTAWDISTATYASKSFADEGYSSEIFFNDTGTVMFGAPGDGYVYQYTLSTAWDLSTANWDPGRVKFDHFSTTGSNFTSSLCFKNSDGSKMYIMNNSAGGVWQFSTYTPVTGSSNFFQLF